MRNTKIRLTPAAALPLAQLVELINDTYRDYPIEVWFNRERLAQMCAYEDVDLQRSVVAWAETRPVGMALLSIRERAGWVSGVGVRPAWRRHGIAGRIMARIQAQAHRAGVHRLRLEVLTQNVAAQALYRQAGFVDVRDLLVLVAEPEIRSTYIFPEGVELTEPAVLLSRFARFHQVEPAWQRDVPSLAHRIDRLTGLGLWHSGELRGYLLAQRYMSAMSVVDLAVDPSLPARPAAAGRLLGALRALAPAFSAHVVNLPEEDPLLPAFHAQDYRVWQRQREMAWSDPAPGGA